MHKDEKWQVYAPNGEPIEGEGWDSALGNPEETGSSAIVGVAVVFIWRLDAAGEIELLWQRRAMTIDRYPGDYDIAAGGHINLGETPAEGAVREAREEIGAVFEKEALNLVTIRSFNNNRIAWVYAVDWTGGAEEFSFDDGEVSEVKWVPLSETREFREKYAKAPLKKDGLTFDLLEAWFQMNNIAKRPKDNYAFIDGQNLIYNTARQTEKPWKVDLARLRVYLREKYRISKAYYFIGAYNAKYNKMYDALENYGYEVVFREHFKGLKSGKKGNVDTDIVFSAMKKIAERERFNKILLISDDGDYYKMVNYFIQKKKFSKLLAPSRKNLSLLYKKKIADKYIDFLDKREIKNKIKLTEE